MDHSSLTRYAIEASTDEAVFLVRASKTGPDLDLIGTEGLAPYHLKIKGSKISTFLKQPAKVSDDTWSCVLNYVFFNEKSESDDPIFQSLKAFAVLESEKSCTLVVQQNVKGITHTIGSLLLECNQEVEIQLFDWASEASTVISQSERQVRELEAENAALKASNESLQAEADEYVRLKSEHEDTLITKFAELLNEKKLKIRAQQLIIDGAAFGDRGESSKSQPTQPSQGSKRKASSSAPSDSSSDGFEEMRDKMVTPEPESAGETTDDEDNSGQAGASHDKDKDTRKSPTPPPPKRILPFSRIGGQKAPKSQQPACRNVAKGSKASSPYHDGDYVGGESDDDDDEL